MAFPLPSHLPRKKDPQDVSTQILTRVSEASSKTLSANLAASWVTELDDTLTQTKERIKKRISDDLPSFNQQLSSAKSIQERLQALTSNVDLLNVQLSDPELGLVPTLLSTLTKHAALSRESLNTQVKHDTLSHLMRCKDDFRSLSYLVQQGRLPEAVSACTALEELLNSSPGLLHESLAMGDLKRRFTAMKARTEEQLNDAFLRSIVISASEIVFRPSVQVRQSDTVLSLPSVLASLSTSALASHLASLRRDITTHYIEYLLRQPASITAISSGDMSGTIEHKISMFPSPPNTSRPATRLVNLATVFAFLNEHFLPHLPRSERVTFARSLCKPLRSAILNHLLIPALPSSRTELPNLLNLVDQAREFEADIIRDVLGDDEGEQEIKVWADTVGMHYERKRRTELLEFGRITIMAPEDESRTFHVDLQISTENVNAPTASSASLLQDPVVEDTDAWGFGDDEPSDVQEAVAGEENGWDFEDEIGPESELAPLESDHDAAGEDPEDAWGLNDDDSSGTLNDENIVDDPWDDGWNDEALEEKLYTNGSTVKPKPARRLEKLTSRSRHPTSDAHSPPIHTPVPIAPPPPTPLVPSLPKQTKSTQSALLTESYMVSRRTKELMQHIEGILQEGVDLALSTILSASSSSNSPSGSILVQAAPLTLELFRAIYPVRSGSALANSPKQSMRFSNDCLYLSTEVDRIVDHLHTAVFRVRENLEDCRDRLKLLGDSWFEETIIRQCQTVNALLDEAEGFVETTDQDRFDKCEDVVNQVLQRTRRLGSGWKPVLNKSKYYDALGAVVDAALSRVLTDILALPDITAAESHRLSELCRILNALEGLFVEDPEQPSFVVSYVPSWLKFSYLSELLEASIADISYLFEEGALVDFDIDELVKLVRALFADTPLRANTITKLLHGHPIQS